MKRLVGLATIICLISVLLLGCNSGISTKDEKGLIADLSTRDGLVDGGTITDLEIIKRLTDEEDRIDTVYVSATLEHENYTAIRSFVMEYVLYNDGWILENACFDGSVNKIIPNSAATEVDIVEAIKSHSYLTIEDWQYYLLEGEYSVLYSDIGVGCVYFEDGTYDIQITDNNATESACHASVIINRAFAYADVTECADVVLYFDDRNGRWRVDTYEVTDLSVEWHLDGYWQTQDYVNTIELSLVSQTENDDETSIIEIKDRFLVEWRGHEEDLWIMRPNSQRLITESWLYSVGYGDYDFLEVYATPNGLYYRYPGITEILEMIYAGR